jgi:hypothetical protein
MTNLLINIELLNQIIKMNKNKKPISIIIKRKSNNRPDAGHWVFSEIDNKWIENSNLIEEMKSFYTLRREDGSSKEVFHVDSFPRQGNTTLRSILLQVFPDILIPDPMAHVTSSTYDRIKKGEIVISAIRDPHDALSSFISRTIFKDQFKDIYISKNKIPKEYILYSVKFYNRYLDFLIKNQKHVYLIHFDKIVKMHTDYICFEECNNKILKFFSEKYNLKFKNDNKPRYASIKYDSSTDNYIKSLLITNRYYLRKIKKSYKLYKKALEITNKNETLFSE